MPRCDTSTDPSFRAALYGVRRRVVSEVQGTIPRPTPPSAAGRMIAAKWPLTSRCDTLMYTPFPLSLHMFIRPRVVNECPSAIPRQTPPFPNRSSWISGPERLMRHEVRYLGLHPLLQPVVLTADWPVTSGCDHGVHPLSLSLYIYLHGMGR